MLTFLRKIRKSLIESLPAHEGDAKQAGGSNKKYLLYAIGEIALVVIGILIALQINNWNVNHQESQQEETLLTEMRKNLKQDVLTFENSLNQLKLRRNKINTLSKLLHDPLTQPHDSLLGYFGAAYGVVPSRINTAIYEDLKSHGFDLIKNDSLRLGINRYFEEAIYRVKQYDLSEQSVNEEIKPYYLRHFKEIQFRTTATPIDVDFVLNDVLYKNLIDYRLINLDSNQLTHHPWFIKEMKNLIRLIDQELSE